MGSVRGAHERTRVTLHKARYIERIDSGLVLEKGHGVGVDALKLAIETDAKECVNPDLILGRYARDGVETCHFNAGLGQEFQISTRLCAHSRSVTHQEHVCSHAPLIQNSR